MNTKIRIILVIAALIAAQLACDGDDEPRPPVNQPVVVDIRAAGEEATQAISDAMTKDNAVDNGAWVIWEAFEK